MVLRKIPFRWGAHGSGASSGYAWKYHAWRHTGSRGRWLGDTVWAWHWGGNPWTGTNEWKQYGSCVLVECVDWSSKRATDFIACGPWHAFWLVWLDLLWWQCGHSSSSQKMLKNSFKGKAILVWWLIKHGKKIQLLHCRYFYNFPLCDQSVFDNLRWYYLPYSSCPRGRGSFVDADPFCTWIDALHVSMLREKVNMPSWNWCDSATHGASLTWVLVDTFRSIKLPTQYKIKQSDQTQHTRNDGTV